MAIFNIKNPRKAFALAASTMLTAVSVTLAGAMLTARGQWQMYAAKSSEKMILETAALAETEDFRKRVHVELESLEGSNSALAGTLTSQDLFSSKPFRRVKLRGGVARTTGGVRAPLLFKQMEQDGLVGAASQQVNDPSNVNSSIIIPSLWVPARSADEKQNPSAVPLGKDDPFYEINCRTSFAALSAYSPSRNPRSSGAIKSGFGNVIVTQSRTFPASAFTWLDFDPGSETLITTPETAKKNDTFDLGRIYTAGNLEIDNSELFTASQIVAIGGVETVAGGGQVNPPSTNAEPTPTPIPRATPTPPEGGWISMEEYKEKALKIRTEAAVKRNELKHELDEKIEEKGAEHEDVLKLIVKHAEELVKISNEEYDARQELIRKLSPEDKASLSWGSAPSPLATEPRDDGNLEIEEQNIAQKMTSSPSSVETATDSGGRLKSRKIKIGDPMDLSEDGRLFEEDSSAVVVPVDDLDTAFHRERRKSLRGTLVTMDNGGTKLIRNNHTRSMENLISEMKKYADCSITFSLSTPDPITGLRHPTVATGGVKLRADTQKPLDTNMVWLGEGESSGAPFYWIRNSGNGQGGKLIFDPSKLKFSSALSASEAKKRGFSIFIDPTSIQNDLLETSRWVFFTEASSNFDGLSVISADTIHVAGDFESTEDSVPSMIVSSEVVAASPVTGKKYTKNPNAPVMSTISAAVITAAPNPARLFRKTTWGGTSPQKDYPRSPSLMRVLGSAVCWGSQNEDSNWVETIALAPREEVLSGELAPSLVPVVAEVRVSASMPTTKKVGFLNSGNASENAPAPLMVNP